MTSTTGTDPIRPLAGIRVVEAAQMISAPFATSILSDQGADVIKVEAVRGGDRMRALGDIRNEMGSVFHACNRGKRSIALDTKTDAGRDVLRRLIGSADVFVQNFRPGAVDRMGVGPDEMRAADPRLVYVSVSGFGATGPYADQMVYDFVIQGLTGLAALEGDGRPRLTRNLTIDKATALTVAQAVSAALVHRERTGDGQHLEVDMLGAGLQFVWPDGMWSDALVGDDALRTPPMSANYDVRPTRDGWITLNLATNSTWPRLCAAVDPTLADDPRFATYGDRQRNAAALAERVDEALREVDTVDVLARLRANDLPGGPVLPTSEVRSDPQVQHNQAIVEYDSPTIGRVREPRPAARFGAMRAAPPASAPAHGADGRAILAEVGLTSVEVDALVTAGVVGAS